MQDDAETKRKLYESACGFENRLDSESEAERLRLYCDTHVRCGRCGHHRPKAEENNPCPCGSSVPFQVESYPS